MVENASEAAGEPCSIIADLPGEKVRLGDFEGTDKFPVESGESVTLVSLDDKFNASEHNIPADSEIFPRIESGDILLVGDGSVSMGVEKHSGERVVCEVVKGGVINPNRGLIVQAGGFEPRSLTEKDKSHLRYVAESDLFDGVALSFVSNADDIVEARKILNENGGAPPVIAKLETKSGVENVSEICRVSDAVMVARGDLALFLPWEELGLYVDHLVAATNESETPWIMATQVAEGLERFSFPTRAEICDIAHWTTEGADGMLLSYETAFGSAPVDTADCVRKILDNTQNDQNTVDL
jgi:pyruvate kinase